MFEEQDGLTDFAKRKQIVDEMQGIIMETRVWLPLSWRIFPLGHQPWVKNFPEINSFLFDSRFRWEQVWIDDSDR